MASGISTVTTAFTEQYSALIYNLAQQKGSKMRNRVRVEPVQQAKNAFFERLGEAAVQEITTRHGDTPLNEIPHSRRRVTPADYNTATLLDNADQIKMLIDPTNPYAVAQANALGREIDDVIIAAAFGSASTGVAGGTSVAFKDESYSIEGTALGTRTALGTLCAVGTIADIDLAKILLMMALFNEQDVDPDTPKHWMVAPKTIGDMLDIEEIGSADYNTIRALQRGEHGS